MSIAKASLCNLPPEILVRILTPLLQHTAEQADEWNHFVEFENDRSYDQLTGPPPPNDESLQPQVLRVVDWKREFVVQGSTQPSYWDLSYLVDLAGIRDDLSEESLLLVGPLDGRRVMEIQGRYISAFFKFVLGIEAEDPFLESPSEDFPEVVILDWPCRITSTWLWTLTAARHCHCVEVHL